MKSDELLVVMNYFFTEKPTHIECFINPDFLNTISNSKCHFLISLFEEHLGENWGYLTSNGYRLRIAERRKIKDPDSFIHQSKMLLSEVEKQLVDIGEIAQP